MRLEEVKKAYAWQDAIELSKCLVSMCEEFSDAETNVVVWHLRQAVVDIPAAVAADLKAGRSATMEPLVKLATELELVDRIYPAIDISDAEERLQILMNRMESDTYLERESAPVQDSEEDDDEQDTAQPAGGTVIAPHVDGVSKHSVNVEES